VLPEQRTLRVDYIISLSWNGSCGLPWGFAEQSDRNHHPANHHRREWRYLVPGVVPFPLKLPPCGQRAFELSTGLRFSALVAQLQREWRERCTVTLKVPNSGNAVNCAPAPISRQGWPSRPCGRFVCRVERVLILCFGYAGIRVIDDAGATFNQLDLSHRMWRFRTLVAIRRSQS
jgi:hypothetical protein